MKNHLFITLLFFIACSEAPDELKLSQVELETSISNDKNFQAAVTGMTTVNSRLTKSLGQLSNFERESIKSITSNTDYNEPDSKLKLESIVLKLGFKGINDYQAFLHQNIRKPLLLTIERFKKDQISDDDMKTALGNVVFLSLNPLENLAGRAKVGCVDNYTQCINNSYATYSYILYGCFHGQTGGLGTDHCIMMADFSLMNMELNCAIGCIP